MAGWNSSTQQFWTSGPTSPRYFVSFFNTFVVSLLLGLSSAIFVLVNPLNDPAITPEITLLSFFYGSVCVLMVVSLSIIVRYLDDLVAGLKVVVSTIRKLHQVIVGMQLAYNFSGPNGVNCGPKFWKRVALALIVSNFCLFLIPLVLPLKVISGGLDAFRFSISAIFPNFYVIPVLPTIVRLLLATVCGNEGCRFFALYVPLFVYFIELLLTFLASLHQLPVGDFMSFLKWIKVFRLIFNCYQEIISQLIGCLMGCGFVIFVTSNLGTLKCYNMLLLSVYLTFPFCSGLAFTMVYLCLPFAVFIAESSTKSIRIRKEHLFRRGKTKLSCVRWKCLRREFICAWPIILNCGNFYGLSRGTETNYHFYVLLRTSDLLLTLNSLGLVDDLSAGSVKLEIVVIIHLHWFSWL